MLPRISSALAQLVKPISATTDQGSLTVRQRKEQAFKRSRPQDFKKEEPPSQNASQQQQQQPSEKPHLTLAKPPVEAGAPNKANASVAHAFIQLFTVLQQKRMVLMRWLGARAYQSSSQNRKGAAKFKKGAMLDRRVG